MNTVITSEQAKKITGGRTPHMPIEYESAVKSLQACINLDEAKYWSDKSDALAAWAKIYRSNDAEMKAKQLKLHAYRRMGELAAELRPGKGGRGRARGRELGPASLLRESGLNPRQAGSARLLARLPQKHFDQIVSLPRPPSPYEVRNSEPSAWIIFSRRANFKNFSWACGAVNPRELAMSISKSPALKEIRQAVIKISEWLDEFEQHLSEDS